MADLGDIKDAEMRTMAVVLLQHPTPKALLWLWKIMAGKGISDPAKEPRTPTRINYHFVVWRFYRGYTLRTASIRLFTCSLS